jgi:undecaprenyl pyrophosphate synthase
LVNHPQWEDYKEHLNNLKNLALQELVVATSEQEMYRLQGKLNLLGRLDNLGLEIKEAINRKEEI